MIYDIAYNSSTTTLVSDDGEIIEVIFGPQLTFELKIIISNLPWLCIHAIALRNPSCNPSSGLPTPLPMLAGRSDGLSILDSIDKIRLVLFIQPFWLFLPCYRLPTRSDSALRRIVIKVVHELSNIAELTIPITLVMSLHHRTHRLSEDIRGRKNMLGERRTVNGLPTYYTVEQSQSPGRRAGRAGRLGRPPPLKPPKRKG
jgi:hypothetical protein